MKRILLLLLVTTAVTKAQIVNIPDPNFKNALLNYDPVIDTNGDGEIQVGEAEALDELFITFAGITDPTGIEAFVNLTVLVLRNNEISNIDISSISGLEVFHLEDNELTSVDMTANAALLNVQLFRNQISSIDLSGNPNLNQLIISDNLLTEIDLGDNPLLEILILSNNQISEVDVSQNPLLLDLVVDGNPISSIDVSVVPLLTRLNVSFTEISEIDISNNTDLVRLFARDNGISEFNFSNNPALEWIVISGNNDSSLDLSLNTELRRLECRENGITSLDLSTNTLMTYLDCIGNEISELNLPASIGLEWIFCADNQLETIDLSQNPELRVVSLENNALTQLDISTNPAIEFLYVRENLVQDIDVSSLNDLVVLTLQNNPIASIDVSANPNLVGLGVSNTNIMELDMSNNPLLEGITASNMFQLEYVNLQNGNNVILDNFIMSNNPELNFVCVDDVAFAIKNFTNITPNATFIDDCSIADGGVNNIQGIVNFDDEDNGCDGEDVGISGLLVNSTDGDSNLAIATAAGGEYSLSVGEGTYTTGISGLPPYYSVSPTEYMDTFVGFDQAEFADFCVTANTTADDLEVSLVPVGEARPGFNATYRLIYENVGTTVLDAMVELTFDDMRILFQESNPMPDQSTASSLSWNLGTLSPFETGSLEIRFELFPPPTNESDDILTFTVMITPNITDETPENNTYTLNQVIVNSQDPNDKLVAQGEEVLIEDADEYLHYTVRFENIGTASAINVRIQDQLDELLDISTLRILDQSHPMRVTMRDGLVEFIFDDINLPSTEQDPEASQGYVIYKIKPLSTVSLGDQIENSADIYFDYNAAIVTNTVVTTFVKSLKIEDEALSEIGIYPNPTSDQLWLKSKVIIDRIELYNLQGQKLRSDSLNANEAAIRMDGITSGLLLLRVYLVDGTFGIYRVIVK